MKALTQSILYFGANSSTSTARHRADALRRLGCNVTVVDPEKLIGSRHRFLVFLDYRSGYRLVQRRLLQALRNWSVATKVEPDLIWVNGGEHLGPAVLKWLRQRFDCPVLLYQNDDPTGSRDGNRFLSLLDSLQYYDLLCLVRAESELEVLSLGAKRTLRVFMSYDEILHAHHASVDLDSSRPVVSFIGTLIPGEPRDTFLLSLLKAGLPLSLIGNGWQRSPHWPSLKEIHQGPGRTGPAYAQALGSAAVSLGMLSHQNRDLITRRSVEVPACGGLFCAERTSEHQLLYEEGQEAVFWSSTDECVEQCRRLLTESQLSTTIRKNGNHQVRGLGVGNEDICRQILGVI